MLALLGIVALLIIRFVFPELLTFSFIPVRVGAILFGCLFLYFSYCEYKAASDDNGWAPARIAGLIRFPLYLGMSGYLFYFSVAEAYNA